MDISELDDILVRASEILDEDGWGTGTLKADNSDRETKDGYNRIGSHCANGCLAEATGWFGYNNHRVLDAYSCLAYLQDSLDPKLVAAIRQAVKASDSLLADRPLLALAYYNDDDARGPEDIHKVFERARKALYEEDTDEAPQEATD